MNLQRLLAMSPSELLFRSKQETSKTLERLRLTTSHTEAPCLFTRLKQDGTHTSLIQLYHLGHDEHAMQEVARNFQAAAPLRFFEGVANDAAPLLIGAIGAEFKAAIIDGAEAVCRGEFSLLGYGRLHLGLLPDWHGDPLTGRRAPMLHWSQINPLDAEVVGDHKLVWELNRHQWLLELGQAYRFTGDERYASTFAALVEDWIQHNPVGVGINWSSALEVSMRMMAWCWALLLFRGSAALTPKLQVTMSAWIDEHAHYVERYLSRYFSPNTHLTGEALGLFYVGTLLTELQGAQRWARLGHEILLQQLQKQVHPDGVYFEQATRYQYYTVEIYLHFAILARENGMQLPAEVGEKLQRMLDFLLALRQPDGSMPQIGDNDGGWLLPLVRRAPADFSALFSTAAVLFNRADYAWAADRIAPETLWLLGAHSQQQFGQIVAAPPTNTAMQIFRNGGYAVLRNSWQHNAHHLVFDTGPLGCNNSGGHGHADLLAIQCSAFGEPYIVDAGTGTYNANDKWRNYFRSTHAHSTITVDGRDQAEPAGPFRWQAPRPCASLLHYSSSIDHDLVEATHDAYRDLGDPIMHRRRILFVKSGTGYWVVVDDLSGSEHHRIEMRYQFAQLEAAFEQQWLRVRGNNGSALLVRSFAAERLNAHIAAGHMTPPRGWVSPNYGQRIPAPVLTYVIDTVLPLRLVTLLYPLPNADSPAPVAMARINSHRTVDVLNVKTASGSEQRISIDEHDIVITQ